MIENAAGIRVRIESAAERGSQVTLSVDGREITAHDGEMLAAALFAAGVRHLRASPRSSTPRGMFCLMGVCQECLVAVDGRRALACQEPVRAGMKVHTDALT